MNPQHHAIIDANLNRVTEGLRVIEDYMRLVASNAEITWQLSEMRHRINRLEPDFVQQLLSRDTTKDVRAGDAPAARRTTFDLLRANFKRAEEGLRVLEEYTANPAYSTIRHQLYELERTVALSALKPTLGRGVYLISRDEAILEQGLAWNVAAIQLRDKTSHKRDILAKAIRLQAKAQAAGVPFIVNDHLDIALASNADGLHTGQDDLPIEQIRRLLGPHKILGRSTSTLEQGLGAQADGADYIGIGPIWSTASKPERAPIGTAYLRQARQQIKIPYVAIGDINLDHMPELVTFLPPMVALIRAYPEIPKIQTYFVKP